ncbi:hypothetical protein DFH09DRAFT_255826 [Mycena vulgaris]|nr:hypothetical protein DFH09DRAFT_255826 [Mycena vulgaris]
MTIELGASHEQTRMSNLLDKIQGLVGAFICILQALWAHLARPYTPRVVEAFQGSQLLADCEKEPRHYADFYQTHAQLLATLKRRDATDAAFETQVLALLAPVKKRLAEITRNDQSSSEAHDPAASHAVPDLPPAPQIFYGRDHELAALVHMFSQGRQAHAALSGIEGAGKSALALALLHHDKIVRVFGARRFFVPSAGVLPCLASALGLPPLSGQDAVLSALGSSPHDSLIVLDDLGAHPPPPLEDLLAALAAFPRVSLLLTLRGSAPRPPGPVYTLPYPTPLGPLPPAAARAVFRAISDLPAEGEGEGDADTATVDAVVRGARYLPRGIVRLAQCAQYEPLPFLLARCAEEGDL